MLVVARPARPRPVQCVHAAATSGVPATRGASRSEQEEEKQQAGIRTAVVRSSSSSHGMLLLAARLIAGGWLAPQACLFFYCLGRRMW